MAKKTHFRPATKKGTGEQGKWEAKQAEALLRKQEIRLKEQTTITGLKPASFWKD